MDSVISLLQYLGITPNQIVPLVLVASVVTVIYWKVFIKPVQQELSDVKDELTDLHNAAKEIQMHLEKDNKFSPQHSLEQKPLFKLYGVHSSPMKPSENGDRLLTGSGFYEIYPSIKDKLFERMDKMNLRTAYDYEAGASDALLSLSNDPAMDILKNYVVNNPDESLELIFGVASWVMRDDYAKYLEGKSARKTQ
jgi:hypothetical protein